MKCLQTKIQVGYHNEDVFVAITEGSTVNMAMLSPEQTADLISDLRRSIRAAKRNR